MNEIYVTVSGRLVADPEARNTRNGVPFAAFRVASTARRVNRSTGEFEDAGTSFVSVTAFRSLGANAAHSLHKGDPVVVHGRMRVNQWVRQDESLGTSVEIDAYSVGHDLSYGTTEFTKVTRPQVDRNDRMSDEEVQAAHARASGEADFNAETDPYVVEGEEPEHGLEPAVGALAGA